MGELLQTTGLTVNEVAIYEFCCSVVDIIHFRNPFYLILCLELFGDTLTFRHFFHQPKEHLLSLTVDVGEVTVELVGHQQVEI